MRRLPVVSVPDSPFPERDRRWLEGALDGASIPVETRASCSECAMLPKAGETLTDLDVRFADTTCCTHLPRLVNYRVGALLASDIGGKARVEARIDEGYGVSPLAVGGSTAEQIEHDVMRDQELFGQSTAHRCVYHDPDGVGCTIWAHRDWTCSSYQCRYTRGVFGSRVWRSLGQLVQEMERTVSLWCLEQLDLSAGALSNMFPVRGSSRTGEARVDPKSDGLYDECWGNWLGRERELYLACHERAATLSWDDVLEIGGPLLRVLVKNTREHLANWNDSALPDRLRRGPSRAEQCGPVTLRIRGFSSFDLLDVPMGAGMGLGVFDGRPLDKARAEAKEVFGTTFDDELLMELYERSILVKG